jgi:prepilin-type N-terminal cleavage/methylation domain-containing protein
MHPREEGFTLIELMIVMVVIGFLAVLAQPLYMNMTNRAKVSTVRANMRTVQLTVEDFSTRNDGEYPQNAADTSVDGGWRLGDLFPGATPPVNPFTDVPTTIDWSNAAGTLPVTDPAGGVALNVTQTVAGGTYDVYEIIGTDDKNVALSLVLSNR